MVGAAYSDEVKQGAAMKQGGCNLTVVGVASSGEIKQGGAVKRGVKFNNRRWS